MILVAGPNGWSPPFVDLWLYNDTWERSMKITTETDRILSVALEDLDGDTVNEVLVGQEDGVLEIFEQVGNDFERIENLFHPFDNNNPDYFWVQSIVVGDLDNDESTDQEILSCNDRGEMATVWKKIGENYQPIENLTLTGDGLKVAFGDLDGDLENEIVVAIGNRPTASVLVYECTGSDWTMTAQYDDPSSTSVRGIEVVDVNSDGQNELLVCTNAQPLVALNYTGSGFSTIWSSTFTPNATHGFVTGDFTNDGELDIVEACSPESVVRVYEFVEGQRIYTYNISIPDVNILDSDGMKIADIDNDDQEELIIGPLNYHMRIYRNDTLLHEINVGYSMSGWGPNIALGDILVESDTTTPTSTTNETITSSTTPTQPNPIDIITVGIIAGAGLVIIVLVVLVKKR
jgi:hypothetical protein